MAKDIKIEGAFLNRTPTGELSSTENYLRDYFFISPKDYA